MVATSWTVTALFADKASHRLGANTTNVLRLVLATVFLALLLWITVGLAVLAMVVYAAEYLRSLKKPRE